jgi:hypothetical protein
MMKTIGDLRRMLAEVPDSLDDAVLEVYCFECPECTKEYEAESEPYPRMRIGGTHGKVNAAAHTVLKLRDGETNVTTILDGHGNPISHVVT